MDFNDDVVLMGRDGPGHLAIAEGKTTIRPPKVSHGKVGGGLSVERSEVRPGDAAERCSNRRRQADVARRRGRERAGPILEIGNTNSGYRVPIGARRFVNAWNRHRPAHHCAVGVGYVASTLGKLGKLLGIEVAGVLIRAVWAGGCRRIAARIAHDDDRDRKAAQRRRLAKRR